MFLLELAYALLIALIIAGIFGALIDSKGPWDSFFALFIVLFLLTWAVAVWVPPFGPVIYGAAWLPFVVVGIIAALLIAAITPPGDKDRTRSSGTSRSEAASPDFPTRSAADETRDEAGALAAIGLFFWLLMVALIITIALAYLA